MPSTQPQPVDPQALGHEQVLGRDHVGVAVLGEARVQAVARLRRLPVADAVGEDHVVLRHIERLTGPEQFAGELWLQELAAAATGAMQDQHRIGDVAAGVARRLADGRVVQTQLRQRRARREAEVASDVVTLLGDERRRLRRAQSRCRGRQRHECNDAAQQQVRARGVMHDDPR